MSGFPENDPLLHDPQAPRREDSLTEAEVLAKLHKYFPYDVPEFTEHESPNEADHRPRTSLWAAASDEPERRTPNFGDVGLLGILACFGFLGSVLLARLAVHFHVWGVYSTQRAATDVHYTIASMACAYLLTFLGALLLFPPLWEKGLADGLQWNAAAAVRRFQPLIVAAFFCFVLALLDEVLLPGPANAPIDKLFDNRAAAWMLFGFGVTFAPFFEESIFRGFLLPALCTAFDWLIEQATGNCPRTADANGHPKWSIPAMVFGSIATSIPFALMHAEQTAWSLGPFLLLVCVSLTLCLTRLVTRSLAASVVVHAAYNFMLFLLMLLGTGGFRHLDKM